MLKLQIIGNLGDDCRVMKSNGEDYLAFNVAHTYKRVDEQTGSITEYTTWVSVTVPGARPNLVPYLVKGTKIYCEGIASVRVYVGRDGHHHAGLNLSCSLLELCGSKVVESQSESHENETF